jgi:hypothetical protein
MSYPVNYPTPQGANIQTFYQTEDWVKPQGASFVWFTLIGAGGGAGYSADPNPPGGGGGGSGAVTNCMVPAFLIPDVLRVTIGKGGIGAKTSSGSATSGGNTILSYQQKSTAEFNLLVARGAGGGTNGVVDTPGQGGTGGAGTVSNYFSCIGIYQSVAGQAGTIGTVTLSPTTFLSAGGASDINGNYGYVGPAGQNPPSVGYFQMQPIIVGFGGTSNQTLPSKTSNGGIGCGGGSSFYGSPGTGAPGADGGDGLAVIITW